MRLYRLKNRANRAWWIIATDLDQAIDLSVGAGQARAAKNVSLVGDQTDFYLEQPGSESLVALLKQGKPGFAVIEVQGGSISGAEFFQRMAQRLANEQVEPAPAATKTWILTRDLSELEEHP